MRRPFLGLRSKNALVVFDHSDHTDRESHGDADQHQSGSDQGKGLALRFLKGILKSAKGDDRYAHYDGTDTHQSPEWLSICL